VVGGDTTRGPLSVCVTAHGFVEPGSALRRDGARAGDDVWASGTLGDAAGALAQWRAGGASDADVQARPDRPTSRVEHGRAPRGLATACIDSSDGLRADLGHVCEASGVGVEIDVDALPVSTALRAGFAGASLRELQASGGDDYELCFSAPPAARAAVAGLATPETPLARIGRTVEGRGVRARDASG